MISTSTLLDAGAVRTPLIILLGCAFFLSGCGNDIDAERLETAMKGFGQACDGKISTEFHIGRNDAWLSIRCDDMDTEKLQ